MSRSICFIGAGASVPFGVPTMKTMVEEFECTLETVYEPYVELYRGIKRELHEYGEFDIEALMTVAQDILDIDETSAKLFDHPSIHYFSNWYQAYDKMVESMVEVARLNGEKAEWLLQAVKAYLAQTCMVRYPQYDIYDEFFDRALFKDSFSFRSSLERGGRPSPSLTIYTTNYDPVLEAYCHDRHLQYEVGERQNRTLDISQANSRLLGDNESLFQIRKLHGSINWYVDERGGMGWLTEAVTVGSRTVLGKKVAREVLIYPVREKYTFREPFYAMFHQLKKDLSERESCYVVGYSFRDEDVLGLFHDALEINSDLRLCVIDPEAEAIVEGKFGRYRSRTEVVKGDFSVHTAQAVGQTMTQH